MLPKTSTASSRALRYERRDRPTTVPQEDTSTSPVRPVKRKKESKSNPGQ